MRMNEILRKNEKMMAARNQAPFYRTSIVVDVRKLDCSSNVGDCDCLD